MKDRTFSELAAFCEELEKTKNRKHIAKILGDFLNRISQEEIPIS
ncbi:MAG: hypothetical protein AB1478_01270 [Nitrospirota bacterium]